MLQTFKERLAEIHISEVDADSYHVGISSAVMRSYARIASLLPQDVPAIIESVISPGAIEDERQMARAALGEEIALVLQYGSTS